MENTSCTSQCHDNCTCLLGNLSDWLRKAFAQLQECSDCTQCQTAHTVQGKYSAQNRNAHILQVAEVVCNRHQDIGKTVRFRCILKQALVLLIKNSCCLRFVAKYFYDLLPVNHFFYIAVYIAQRCLLCYEIFSALSANMLDNHHHKNQKGNDKQREPNTCYQHRNKHSHNRNRGRDELRQTLCHHLPERISIVGIQAHNIARCILVKIANRQFLHMGKHIIPNLFQNTLRNWHHQPDV